MKQSCVIIDDEPSARENLSILLSEFIEDLTVLGEADSVQSGVELLNKTNPDIVFLDIQLGARTAFEVLEKVSTRNFQLIFITAFNNYAIKAFEMMALDYLLKPIDIDKLINAVERASKLSEKINSSDRLNSLIQNLKNVPKDKQKIAIATSEGYELIYTDQILYCIADGSYTHFYFSDQKKKVVSKNLKYYENLLSEFNFIRAHSSCLVNKSFIQTIGKAEGGFLKMEDGKTLPISKKMRVDLENQIKLNHKF